MDGRDELLSITFRRDEAEALAAVANIGLAAEVGLARITAPSTAERGLAELARAIDRRGATLTATMAWIEADILAHVAESGLAIIVRLPAFAEPVDLAHARAGLKALRAAL